MSHAWQPLGAVPPGALVSARQTLHQAAHVVQSLGRSIRIHRDDDSHASMTWHPGLEGLAGLEVNGHRLALRFADFELAWIGAAGAGGTTGEGDATDAGGADDLAPAHRFALAGRTEDDAVDWLRGLLGRNAAAHTLDVPYDLPPHPVQDGEPYPELDRAAATELAHWFADADLALADVVAAHAEAGPVRVWPHHFDSATLLQLDGHDETARGRAESRTRTVGVGLSPGDDSYPEPYFYVSPYPFPPNIEELPDLPEQGFWRADSWVGAVLRGRDIVAASDPREACRRFLDAAVTSGRQHLETCVP